MTYPVIWHDLLDVRGESWYLAGGIDPGTVAGVRQPKGAASLAASYLRLAGDQGYANIDPAIVGGLAPIFDTATGWYSASGANKRLDTGIPVAAGYSIAVRVYLSEINREQVVGYYKDANTRYMIWPRNTTASKHSAGYGNSGIQSVSPIVETGVMILTPQGMYVNGSLTIDLSSYTWTGSVSDTFQIFCRRRGDLSSYDAYYAGYVMAIAFYKTTISAAQVASVSAAMALL